MVRKTIAYAICLLLILGTVTACNNAAVTPTTITVTLPPDTIQPPTPTTPPTSPPSPQPPAEDNPVEGWSVLAQKDDYDDVDMTNLPTGYVGITSLHDVRGASDKFGNVLAVTEVAIADELAAAADLVKGKLGSIPVAVVRGLTLHDDGAGVRPLIRDSTDDMFRLGTQEAAFTASTPTPATLTRSIFWTVTSKKRAISSW